MAPFPIPNLRDTTTFATFCAIPWEYEQSPVYHVVQPHSGIIIPAVRWYLVAEITDITEIIRLRLHVKDSNKHEFMIHAYTNDYGIGLSKRCQAGHTVVLPYAESHVFMDGTAGIRLEDGQPIAVLPVSMKKLLAANDRFFGGKSKDMCNACHLAVTSGVSSVHAS